MMSKVRIIKKQNQEPKFYEKISLVSYVFLNKMQKLLKISCWKLAMGCICLKLPKLSKQKTITKVLANLTESL